MKSRAILNLMFIAIVALGVAVPAIAQDKAQAPQAGAAAPAAQPSKVAVGRKQKISGVVISREADKMIVRDINGSDVAVTVSGATKISEKKANPFRSAKNYPVTALLRGLEVEVEGRGDSSGVLTAEKIKFTDDDFGVARSLDSRVAPVETRVTTTEGRMDGAETRITAAEQNAQRLSGQLEELAAVANTNRAEISATNDRINQIDNYEARQPVTVNFKVNSAVLSDEAKAALDEIAAQAKNEKGYLIQVTGFASADGPEAKNRALSERRADAVKRYLAEHDIPLHRMINPFGFGELKPVAENNTREGRKQNRRVEVAILVNKGLTASASGRQ